MVLVYEHMAKGNLNKYLSGKNKVVLSWEQRLRIAIDVAQALEYLHDGCNPPIIHKDVKTENILLNEKFQAKVADFGWSRSMPSEGGSYVSTAIVGTLGYVDPEYNRTLVPSKKTNVYSFGIVLLELISGRPAIIKTTEESPCDIADWVHQVTAKGDIKMIVDPRLQGEFEVNSAWRAVETAISCVPLSSIDRPTLSHVVLELKECLKIAIAHEKIDNAEEDQGPVGIEAVHERTDKVEEDHDPFGSEAAYERTDDAEEDQGPLGVEAAHEVTDNAKEDQGLVCIEAAHERNDNKEEGHGPVGIGAAHERHDDGKEDHGSVGIEAADEITDNAEVDQGPFGIEGTQERTDNVEVNHGPVGIEAAHERTDDAEEDHGPVGIETTQERTDNVEEDHGLVGIEAAHDRNDNGGEDHNPVGIEAADERTDNVEENLGPVSIESVHEGTDDAEEDHGPDAIEASQERTDNVEENPCPVGIEAAHERNDNVEEDHGPDGIELAHERTDNMEEDHSPLGIESAMAIQERTNSYGKAKEKKEKKKNVVVSPVASITSVVVPSDIVVKTNEDDETFGPKNQHLTYSEVERITENFQKELGKGASAIVYHGHLSNGTEVAVKKLSPSSILGSKQFKTEAQLLTRVHHKNLVSLFGYCDEGSNMVLIYEYMAKGNLKAYLSGKTEAALSWEQRLRIAIDAAQALEYLHNGCNPPIIHRDVKTENILLNEKLQAKVADFGWSKSMPVEGGSYVSTAIVGTPGYLDPEYHRSSVPNEKTDVYSFGIVLLELISSRPAIIKITDGSPCNITYWVRPIFAKGDIRMIVDPRLQGKFETNSARRAIETAMSCVSFSSTDRPIMSDIIVELRECLKIAMTHERTKEGHASVGIEASMAVQESFDGNQDFLATGSNEKAEEKEKKDEKKKKKKKKQNFIGPAVTSITSVLVPSGALASLGKSKKKWPHAKDKNYSRVAKITNNFQQSLVPCASIRERNLLADTAKIVEKNKICKRKDDFCRKLVTDGLLALGYDASVCKSRWEKSSSYPAGEYEYIDVIVEGERLLIDIDFRSEFEIARSTKSYKAILQTLPHIFVGKPDRLQEIISIVLEASRQSLKKKGMHLPPWRKAEYVKSKWLSPYTRTTPTSILTPTNNSETHPKSDKNQALIPTKSSSGELEIIFREDNSGPDDSMFAESSVEEEKTENTAAAKQWNPPEIKPKKSLQIAGNIVTGFASVIGDGP